VRVPGGRLAPNVFGPIERNPATCALAGALDPHVGPGASVAKRAEHALAGTAELRALVAQFTLAFDHRVCDGGTAGGFLRSSPTAWESPCGTWRPRS
jgi:hypothetical protein